MVVYGPDAPTREGDVDHLERVFISVPAEMKDRLYLRLFDPEPAGANDTRYGGNAVTRTLFRLSGGAGRLQRRAGAGTRSRTARRRRRRIRPMPASPAGGCWRSGASIASSPTDDAWVTLAPFRAADGEVIDGRAYFRLDVIGEAGDDGNAFTVEASLSPDRSEPAPDVRLFAHQATVRWRERTDPTEVRFTAPGGGDAAASRASMRRKARSRWSRPSARRRSRRRGRTSGRWRSSTAPGGTVGITLRGGRESPNDVTLALFDAGGKPVDLEMPPRTAAPARAAGGGGGGAAAGGLHGGRLRRLGLDRGAAAGFPLGFRRRQRQRAGGAGASLRRAGALRGGAAGAGAGRPDRARGDDAGAGACAAGAGGGGGRVR